MTAPNPQMVKMTENEMKAMRANDDGSVTGYMCATDWECEIGGADDGNHVYPSIESLKRYKKCWESCGIVEVRVTFVSQPVIGKEDVYAAYIPHPGEKQNG